MTARLCRPVYITVLMLLPIACAAEPEQHVVGVQNFTYAPARIEVGAGDTIMFVNHDVVPHTATARDGSWDTREIAAGDTARVAVSNGGEYYCAFHPNMTASVSLAER